MKSGRLVAILSVVAIATVALHAFGPAARDAAARKAEKNGIVASEAGTSLQDHKPDERVDTDLTVAGFRTISPSTTRPHKRRTTSLARRAQNSLNRRAYARTNCNRFVGFASDPNRIGKG